MDQKILSHKKILQLCYHVVCRFFKALILFVIVSATIIILSSKVALVLNVNLVANVSQHLSDVQRILTYEPRNCAHSRQAFKLFLTVSPAHRIITTSTWALEFPIGGHFQHFHRHAHFFFPSFSFEKTLHSSSESNAYWQPRIFCETEIWFISGIKKILCGKSNSSLDYLTYCLYQDFYASKFSIKRMRIWKDDA